ncbi:MAG: response regulator transcription factor [Syntrophorhabdaceae bacterium]|nr:response regulator transcription factor [Syntrophorhabdaceae bacterium]
MTIVIVDDHVNLRRLLHEWLKEELPACSFVEMRTAREALVYCRREAPLAVIMDIDMPGMNGIDATIELKAMLPDTKVVILTIHENSAYKEAALKAGANAFVTKRRLYDDLVPALSHIVECQGRIS